MTLEDELRESLRQEVRSHDRIVILEAALRQISQVGHRQRGPYVEGSWFAAIADSALADFAPPGEKP
jgi:hypothetical protein